MLSRLSASLLGLATEGLTFLVLLDVESTKQHDSLFAE